MRYKPTNYGDTREVERFTILPVSTDDGETRWLEKVKIQQEYDIDDAYESLTWRNKKFVDEKDK